MNYGGIGGVIGHEMGHGFDDQGAKSDAHGVLRDWWSADDVDAIQGARPTSSATQYDTYSSRCPACTSTAASRWAKTSATSAASTSRTRPTSSRSTAKPAPVIDGFTGDQRFFLGCAQVWRGSPATRRCATRCMTDPHSPPQYRVNGVVRNIDAWYAAFDVKPGDALYLAPEKRVQIW